MFSLLTESDDDYLQDIDDVMDSNKLLLNDIDFNRVLGRAMLVDKLSDSFDKRRNHYQFFLQMSLSIREHRNRNQCDSGWHHKEHSIW